MKTWPSWLLGSTVGATRRTLPSTSPAPTILIRAVWLTASLAMSRVGTMPTRSNSLRAMIGEQRLALARGDRADRCAVELATSPATGACTSDRAAFRQRQPRQRLPGGDGIAGIGQDLRRPSAPAAPAAPRSPRADRIMPDDLDNGGKAGFRRLQHRDRRALAARRPSSAARACCEGEAEQGRGEKEGQSP